MAACNVTLACFRGMPGIRVGLDWVTALTRIWAAGIVGSESVRAGQFATHRTVVTSLSQGSEEVVGSEELALFGWPPRVAFGCGQGPSAVRGLRALQALSVPGSWWEPVQLCGLAAEWREPRTRIGRIGGRTVEVHRCGRAS